MLTAHIESHASFHRDPLRFVTSIEFVLKTFDEYYIFSFYSVQNEMFTHKICIHFFVNAVFLFTSNGIGLYMFGKNMCAQSFCFCSRCYFGRKYYKYCNVKLVSCKTLIFAIFQRSKFYIIYFLRFSKTLIFRMVLCKTLILFVIIWIMVWTINNYLNRI